MIGARLLADIGGTNARFARAGAEEGIFALHPYEVDDFPDVGAALFAYLSDTAELELPTSAAIAAAGPVLGGEVQLTNAAWRITPAEIRRILGDVPVSLFNDLEAVALALPHLSDGELRPIGGPPPHLAAANRMLALNVGTGFGAATITRLGTSWVAAPSEAGHMSFGAATESELRILPSSHPDGLIIEDALSGNGLVRIYVNECRRRGSECVCEDAEDVISRINVDEAASATFDIFTRWLGRAARDLVLASTSWGGVFLTGSVVQNWAKHVSPDKFRRSFEASEKMREPLSRTPTVLITRPDVAMLGLAHVPLA